LLVVARIDKEGKLFITQTRMVAIPEARQEAVTVDGKVFTRTVNVMKVTPVTQTQAYDLKEVRAVDSEGKRVDQATLTRQLEKETPVLLSSDGQPVSAVYLDALKKGTLVLQLPMPGKMGGPDVGSKPPVRKLPLDR